MAILPAIGLSLLSMLTEPLLKKSAKWYHPEKHRSISKWKDQAKKSKVVPPEPALLRGRG
jgi:hypothetical protein